MILGLDLDGVVADYIAGLDNFIADKRQSQPFGTLADYNFTDWSLGEEITDFRKQFVAERGFRSLPVVKGAKESLKRLFEAGVILRITTSRLQEPGANNTIIKDTIEWLEQEAIPYHEFCAVTVGKTTLACDLYIDDAPHNIEDFEANNLPALLFDTSYNQNIKLKTAKRVKDWTEATTAILDYQKSFKG